MVYIVGFESANEELVSLLALGQYQKQVQRFDTGGPKYASFIPNNRD